MTFSLGACASDQTRLVQGKQDFIQEDYHQAFKTLQPLAVKGNPDAQYAVGYMYYYGYGTPQDNQLAFKWMQSAAAQGQRDAIQALKMLQPNSAEETETANPVFSSLPPDYRAQE
ncbi:MAG: sel1 repeat family protein [Legionellales bacterium]|nr:sel1 repeat family protein [Legionellales bacterium]